MNGEIVFMERSEARPVTGAVGVLVASMRIIVGEKYSQ